MEVLMGVFNKILVIQTAYPGDAILTLPLIQYLNKKYNTNLIDVLCIPATKEIFEASPYVNEAIIVDKKNEHNSFLSLQKFVKKLKQNVYDAVFCPHRSFRSAMITLLLNVKETFGFDNSSVSYAFKNVISYNYSDHEVKRNLLLSGDNFDEENWKILPELNYPDEITGQVNQFLSENNLNKKFITVAPASVWWTKQYPVEYFKKIVEELCNQDEKIILIGSEKDYELCSRLQVNENVINSAGRFSLIGSAALLKKSKLLISNDSAPAHLGMCVDIPVLMLYCSTVPEFGFYPYNDKSFSLSYNDLKCKPCGIHGYDNCPLGTFECAIKLKPAVVMEKIYEILKDEKSN